VATPSRGRWDESGAGRHCETGASPPEPFEFDWMDVQFAEVPIQRGVLGPGTGPSPSLGDGDFAPHLCRSNRSRMLPFSYVVR
jgi:hypothetical protein